MSRKEQTGYQLSEDAEKKLALLAESTRKTKQQIIEESVDDYYWTIMNYNRGGWEL